MKAKNSSLVFNLAFLFMLLLGLSVRLVDLTDQPIDFHPTRQLRGAIIARGMYYEMAPAADPALRQQTYAFWQSTGQYEPSILERLTALTYLLLGREALWVARLYSLLFWIIAGAFLFLLARRMGMPQPDSPAESVQVETPAKGWQIAWLSALAGLAYFNFLPFAIQASRSFQPDPAMVMWLVLFVYALYRWCETQALKWTILAGVFAGLAVLTKAVIIYPVAGAALALVLHTYRRKPFLSILQDRQVWLVAALMVIPTAVYYLARGGRASEYFSSWTLALSHLLIEPSFYLRWLNLAQELLGWFALLLALAGVLLAAGRNRAVLIGLWGGYLLYGLFLPYQMYTHSYYHLMLVPIVALSLIPLVQAFFAKFLRFAPRIIQAMFLILALGWLVISVRSVIVPILAQDYRNEPAYWQEIASHLPDDGKIIALTQDYGYRLMYYGWRKVVLWPNRGEQALNALRGSEKAFQDYFAKRIQEKRYFLITAFRQFEDQPDLKQMLNDHYPLLAEGQGYLIFDLAQPR